MTLRDFKQLLSHTQPLTDGGFTARCPAHDDRKNSLSVGVGEGGRILVKCHAGCTALEIVAAMDLHLSDLMPEEGGYGGGHLPMPKNGLPAIGAPANGANGADAVYEYVDEGGALLFEVLRKPGKKFQQRRPDGAGGWVYKLEDTRRVLYRLPRVLAAIKAGRPVFVVEGEKDVHTLEGLGLVATTNPHGAGKWRDDYTETLRGARVAILPDNDEAGRQHARTVALALLGAAAEVRIVFLPGLPEKGDATDWTRHQGGTRELLAGLCREAAILKTADDVSVALDLAEPEMAGGFTAAQLLMMEFPPAAWIVEEVLPEGATLLVGKPKTGKSFLALNIAFAVAAGGRALGKVPVTQGRVLYLVLEGTKRNLQQRVQALCAGEAPPEGLHFYQAWPQGEAGMDALRRWLRRRRDTRLVVIDTLKKVRAEAPMQKGLYDRDYESVAPFATIAEETGASCVIVHHTNKLGSAEDPFDLASGTTGLMAAVDTGMVLMRSAQHAGVDLYIRGRDVEERQLALTFDAPLLTWTLQGDAAAFSLSTERRAILEALQTSAEPLGPKDIADARGLDYGSVRVMLGKMLEEGEVSKMGYGKYGISAAAALAGRGSVNRTPPRTPLTPITLPHSEPESALGYDSGPPSRSRGSPAVNTRDNTSVNTSPLGGGQERPGVGVFPKGGGPSVISVISVNEKPIPPYEPPEDCPF